MLLYKWKTLNLKRKANLPKIIAKREALKKYLQLKKSTIPGTTRFKSNSSACAQFYCKQTQIQYFSLQDPLNPVFIKLLIILSQVNTVQGFVCKKEGNLIGSLYIAAVNENELADPILVYGTPKFYPFSKTKPQSTDSEGKEELNEKSNACAFYFFSNKYNGTNITFYKYYDAKGNIFVTGTPLRIQLIFKLNPGFLHLLVIQKLKVF